MVADRKPAHRNDSKPLSDCTPALGLFRSRFMYVSERRRVHCLQNTAKIDCFPHACYKMEQLYLKKKKMSPCIRFSFDTFTPQPFMTSVSSSGAIAPRTAVIVKIRAGGKYSVSLPMWIIVCIPRLLTPAWRSLESWVFLQRKRYYLISKKHPRNAVEKRE